MNEEVDTRVCVVCERFAVGVFTGYTLLSQLAFPVLLCAPCLLENTFGEDVKEDGPYSKEKR
jgi:hypothetical protein